MSYSWILTLVFVLSFNGMSAIAAEGNSANGKRLAVTCAACHGTNGISNNPLWPNLAGQKNEYIVKQLKAFKNESRKDLLMAPMAKNLSDADIDDLAAYFASLSASGSTP